MITAPTTYNEARVLLRDFLARRFDLIELKVLAFDLAVSFDSLPHRTTLEFATELVSYFERREQLDFLVRTVLQRRPNAQLAKVLANLPPSSDRKKAQIIIEEDLIQDEDSFRRELAESLGLSPDDVMVIAALPGSLHILIGFTADAVSHIHLSRLEGGELCGGEIHITSVELFEELDSTSKLTWQHQATGRSPWRIRLRFLLKEIGFALSLIWVTALSFILSIGISLLANDSMMRMRGRRSWRIRRWVLSREIGFALRQIGLAVLWLFIPTLKPPRMSDSMSRISEILRAQNRRTGTSDSDTGSF